MTRIRAPANLPELVRATFNRAKTNGDVNFYPTQAAILHVNSIPFQLRFSPALASKPKPPKPAPTSSSSSSSSSSKPPPFDPFADPPPSLVIAKLDPPDHILVLNKFAIVPEHFILATAAFAPQTHLLTPADLGAARACIDAYGGRLFVFFNSGEHSGASQPHRHLQLLPVDRMRDGLPEHEESGWEVLADVLGRTGGGEAGHVPFRCFVERLADNDNGHSDKALHAAYLRLYRRACEAVLGTNAQEEEGEEGEARISYNLAMTRDVMVLCPRRSEGGPVVVAAAGGKEAEETVVGRLALNGTVLAGTALVKSQAEWDALRADPALLVRVLSKI
ncbi:hypothetical protein MAPG_06197 [Magnaporthiopsis poae ATCC 64411]|uniref:Uncharacterized protein n=1 Tax=Magnaporthiopsis poae (strain ATCC 64411 / 73-15) TaxID=644358 RepID=A0A0C4E1D8_MAGP6|nr:hypothetical protein MAPG_06197 [Magnaporthiopsis poae ATCC 64411]